MPKLFCAFIITIAVLGVASNGVAQCSEPHSPELTSAPSPRQSGTCDGNPTTLVVLLRDFDVWATTACQTNDWKRQGNLNHTMTGNANERCGNTPANTPPICTGAVSTPYDMGYDDASHTHKFRIEEFDSGWDGAHCTFPPSSFYNDSVPSEGCRGEFCCGGSVLTECQGLQGDFNQSECTCNFATPIILDMSGNGFQLTGFAEGVAFDLTSTGSVRQMAWTAPDSDDAFLVLDRNGNGIVDGGGELFGNYTPTPDGKKLNGFEALAVFDSNHDGVIDTSDPVYSELQLWTDRNHNGISEASELTRLADSGITAISVEFQESRRKDRYGNLFRYRARVVGRAGPLAYDVNFVLSDDPAPISRRPAK